MLYLNVCLANANKFWFLRYIHFVQQYITSSLSKIYPCTLRCFAYFRCIHVYVVFVNVIVNVSVYHMCNRVSWDWASSGSNSLCRRSIQLTECEWMWILAPMPRIIDTIWKMMFFFLNFPPFCNKSIQRTRTAFEPFIYLNSL